MTVLIVYGTSEGQTRKIAEWTAEHARSRGHQVELHASTALPPVLDLKSYQAFIVAASVHQRSHQETITDFVLAHRELLNARPSAFISVSLSAALEETKAEAQQYVDEFLAVTGWRPGKTLLLGGALRLTEYDYFQEQIVKFIVMKRGGMTGEERDRDFTDWNALSGFIDEFLAAAA